MNEETHQTTKFGGPMAPPPNTPVEVVDVQFRAGAKVYFFDPNGIRINSDDHVIIETTRGPEYGICAAGNHNVPFKDIVPPLRKVLRIANEADKRTLAANRVKEKRAFEVCQQKIQEHKLDMQLVSAEYAFDGSKILFFFTSDDRVDFRELVKHLAGIFRTRIELRQIGVRDKAKMVGGLGICGRPFCCTEFLDDFQPVSIKMAKTQNLSLNPAKISGTCGRLMCCLKYEQDAYEDLLRTSPKLDSFVDTPDGRGTVVEVNLLRQRVKVCMEEQPESENVYHNSEICVLRSGKAKKNEPPISPDLAPISGNGKRPRLALTLEESTPMQLDPIRFRYRPDDIVEDQEPATKPEEPKRKKRSADSAGKETHHREAPDKEYPGKSQSPKEQPAPQDSVGSDSHRSEGRKSQKNKTAKQKKPPVEAAPQELTTQPKQTKKTAKSPAKPDAANSNAHSRHKSQKSKADRTPKTEVKEARQEANHDDVHRRRRPPQRSKKPHDGNGHKKDQ